MEINKIKDAGKWLMVTGAGIFTCGAGISFICNYIEKKEMNKIHYRNMLDIEERECKENNELARQALQAKIDKDNLYSEKLIKMDSKEFAKFHAENVAKADQEVMDNANRLVKEAKNELLETKIKCQDEITSIRSECLKKIEEANKARDEAVEKYKAIVTIFDNKDEILEAKEALEKFNRKTKENKKDKEELIESIKDILDD